MSFLVLDLYFVFWIFGLHFWFQCSFNELEFGQLRFDWWSYAISIDPGIDVFLFGIICILPAGLTSFSSIVRG